VERTDLIDHLIEHYVARDLFREVAHRQLQARGLPSSTSILRDGEPDHNAVFTTRKSLGRCKPATLEHLHGLLHNEPVLDEAEHLHTDEDIFRFVIEEDSDAPTNAVL
jgi:hypothetical protein